MRAHAGQWALPGGRMDDGETPEQAALRETARGGRPGAGPGRVLGRLDDYVTRSGYAITPVVVWAGAARDLTLNAHEVASVHRIPVAELHARPTRPSNGPPRSAFGASPQGAPPAARQSRFRGGCWEHGGGQRRVVDGDRVVLVMHTVQPAREPRLTASASVVTRSWMSSRMAFVEGADGAAHLHAVGDDVLAHAAADGAQAHHRRLLGDVDAAADHRLQPSTTCAAVTIGSTPSQGAAPWVWRPCTVIFSCRSWPSWGPAGSRPPTWAARVTCSPKIACGTGFSSAPSATIIFGAAVLAFGRHLLGRLEDELHAAAQLRAQPGQHLATPIRMATWQSWPQACITPTSSPFHCRPRLGRERQVDLFGDRQAVHVGAQRHHRAGQRALQQAHHAGVGHAGAHLVQAQRRRWSATMPRCGTRGCPVRGAGAGRAARR
jgi:hypothetical protein